MTGDDVRRIRVSLGLEPARFAQLLGVHPSTLYRWEQAEASTVRVEPLQLQLLTALDQRVSVRSPQETTDLGEAIVTGLLVGGSLFALYKLLEAVFDDERRSGGAVARTTRARARSSPSTRKRRT